MINKYIFVRHNGKIIKITFDDVLYIKIDQSYAEVNFFNKPNKPLIHTTLNRIIEVLPKHFLRCQDSFIVNVDKIKFIQDNIIYFEDEKIYVPLSEKHKKEFMNRIPYYKSTSQIYLEEKRKRLETNN